ncbi:MAG: YfiR/HmsC family protein [Sulfuricurvum sp.]|nr:YfiR/HmsC family protein [Sulfuricurvum sp.]MDP3021649.1 YfiR/HmsC family protein [Sulfuricurvum sp.]
MLFLTKLFTVFCLATATIHASAYDDETLSIFSKILPRMILMSSQKEKIKESIQICVVNDKIDERSAISLIDKLHDAYPNGISNHPLVLTNTTYASMDKCQNNPLIFLFNSNDKNIEKALQYSHDHKSMSISYDPKYLENGVDASLFLGRKVTPYLNINALRKNGIEVDNLLIRISKIYLYEGEK